MNSTRTFWSVVVLVVAIAVVGWVIYAGKQVPAPQPPAGEVPSDATTGSTEQPKGKLPAGSVAPGTAEQVRAGTWVWTKTVNADESVVAPKKPGVFTLKFEQDGRVTGKTDCNGFGGTYTLGSDGIISFGPFMSTQMYCEGSQESEYSTAVSASHHYTVNDTELVLQRDGKGGAVYFKKQ